MRLQLELDEELLMRPLHLVLVELGHVAAREHERLRDVEDEAHRVRVNPRKDVARVGVARVLHAAVELDREGCGLSPAVETEIGMQAIVLQQMFSFLICCLAEA